MNKGTCTLCFADDIKTFKLKESNLQSVYEQISGVKIEYEDYYLCYICRARLHQCYLLVQQILNLHKDIRENNTQNKCEPLTQLSTHRCKDISIGLPAEHKSNGTIERRDLNEEDVHIKQEEMDFEVKHEFHTDCSDAEELQATDYKEEFITNDVENNKCKVKREINMELPTFKINKNNILLDIVLPDSITITRKKTNTKINTTGIVKTYIGKSDIHKSSKDICYIDKSDIDESGISKSYIDKSDIDESGIDKSYIDKSDIDESCIDKSYIDKSDINESGIGKSYIDESGIDKSYIDKSDIDVSGIDKSYIDKSDIDESGIDKKFRCDICDKAFKRSTYVTTHKRIHTGDKPYVCDVCQERFRHQSHLTTHKRKHTGAKPYACRFCAKKFSHSSSLLMHTNTHTRDKPFACDVCEKKFHRRHDLKTHNRIHNGDKPYACDVCSKKFTHVSHLITHKRTHTGVKPYHCEVCKKRFKHNSGVKKHMITKHKGSYILGV